MRYETDELERTVATDEDGTPCERDGAGSSEADGACARTDSGGSQAAKREKEESYP